MTEHYSVYTYTLLDWIDVKKLNWISLSTNSMAIDLLTKNLEESKSDTFTCLKITT